MTATLTPVRTAAIHLLAAWMGERFFRTFRVADDEEATPFDALLRQRDRRVGVTVATLWDDAVEVAGARELADALDAFAVEHGAFAVWVPPRASLVVNEQALLVDLLTEGMRGLAPGERHEVTIPVTVKLAKIQDEGSYVSVGGGMSPVWLALSEHVSGAYHLDSHMVHRLPEDPAAVNGMVEVVREHTTGLRAGEFVDIAFYDTWTVSRLPDSAPRGVTVVATPREVDPQDGASIRRLFRQAVQRAVDQKQAAQDVDLSVLVVVGPFARIEDELVTAALRGMNPALYGALDLVALVADGSTRQVLQPRTLPWEPSR